MFTARRRRWRCPCWWGYIGKRRRGRRVVPKEAGFPQKPSWSVESLSAPSWRLTDHTWNCFWERVFDIFNYYLCLLWWPVSISWRKHAHVCDYKNSTLMMRRLRRIRREESYCKATNKRRGEISIDWNKCTTLGISQEARHLLLAGRMRRALQIFLIF